MLIPYTKVVDGYSLHCSYISFWMVTVCTITAPCLMSFQQIGGVRNCAHPNMAALFSNSYDSTVQTTCKMKPHALKSKANSECDYL